MGFFDILRKKERSISYNTKQSPISNALKLAKSMNTDYIEIPHEICVCENCAPYINRVYCISGKDNRFPKLPNFILENSPGQIIMLHPLDFHSAVCQLYLNKIEGKRAYFYQKITARKKTEIFLKFFSKRY